MSLAAQDGPMCETELRQWESIGQLLSRPFASLDRKNAWSLLRGLASERTKKRAGLPNPPHAFGLRAVCREWTIASWCQLGAQQVRQSPRAGSQGLGINLRCSLALKAWTRRGGNNIFSPGSQTFPWKHPSVNWRPCYIFIFYFYVAGYISRTEPSPRNIWRGGSPWCWHGENGRTRERNPSGLRSNVPVTTASFVSTLVRLLGSLCRCDISSASLLLCWVTFGCLFAVAGCLPAYHGAFNVPFVYVRCAEKYDGTVHGKPCRTSFASPELTALLTSHLVASVRSEQEVFYWRFFLSVSDNWGLQFAVVFYVLAPVLEVARSRRQAMPT